MIRSRLLHYLASVLLRILPSGILIAAVSFVLTSQSAEAAAACGTAGTPSAGLTSSFDNVSWLYIVAVVGALLLTAFVVRVRRQPVLNGVEGMIGSRVVAISALTPEGRVNYFGENWSAILDVPGLSVPAGTELQIVSVQGLCLRVRPLHTGIRPFSE